MALVVKNPPANAGDPGSIPGSGRSIREGIGYPLQYSWAFLVAQLVKNPPAMWEIWVQSLGWEDPPEEGIPLENSTDCIVHGVTKSQTLLSDFHCCEKVPGGSDGKESACSAGDPGLIPGSGRSPGGRHGNPFQYSCLETPYG